MRIAKDGVHHHFITLLACILNSSIHLITLKCPSQTIAHPYIGQREGLAAQASANQLE